jgi:hypothetical protein
MVVPDALEEKKILSMSTIQPQFLASNVIYIVNGALDTSVDIF